MDQHDNPLVVFLPSGKRGRFARGTPILQAARQLGVDIDSVCGGRAMCGRCQVVVAEGEFAKHAVVSSIDNVSPPVANEVRMSERSIRAGGAEGPGRLAPGRRLSCSMQLLGDVVIDVPASSQVHRQVVRKAAEERDIELFPLIHLHFVEVGEPDMHSPIGDLQRLYAALYQEWQLEGLNTDLQALQTLQPALKAGERKVTVAVHDRKQIVGIWPGLHERALGMAVDVGSTTIAAHLCDLTSGDILASGGMMNPQIRFGEDLMSRVSYSMMNPGGAEQMTKAVRQALDELARQVIKEAGDEYSVQDILEVTLVGNPIMHHLLLGIDPVELGGAPFALATSQAMHLRAAALDLHLHPNARAYILPCIAGHVGADTAGVILSERPDQSEALTLLVDVGTNAEIVLGNRDRLLACSSPTGPAFEGAQISCGQRAAPGAIERVRICAETLEPRFRIIGSVLWSDDPKFATDESIPKITGICGSGIIEVIAEMYLAGIITQDGVIRGDLAARSPRIIAEGRTFSYVLHDPQIPGEPVLRITQNDVRAIQLAKAALYAGVALLMDHLGTTTVQRIRLAGAFGSHIDPKYAMILGLIPDCDLTQVASAGNAAGTGATIALLDARSRPVIEGLVRDVEKIETAIEPRFQQHFVEAMAIPHKTAPFPHLRSQVALPAAVTNADASASGGASGAARGTGRRSRRPT